MNDQDKNLFEEHKNYGSDSYYDLETETDFNLEAELKNIGKKINKDVIDNLLKILIRAGHDLLLRTANTLLNTPKFTKTIPCENGEYFHYGLKNSLKDFVNRGISLPEIINLDVGIDRLPLSKTGKKNYGQF